MVMETPSPECVGREFVLQYYTMLHEAPRYLHRFYSSTSSYVHGGIGEDRPPAVGQAEIHKRIMELKFLKCHTKIRHVDSQATINNAVVVQVSGELSNNNEPMRRFMQTFVLAPQTPNKFYVHNDIFRYQDEIFCDSDTEDTNQEENMQASAATEVNTEAYYESEPTKPAEPAVPLSNGDAHVEHTAPQLNVPEVPRAVAVEPPQVSTVVPAPTQAVPEPVEVAQQQEPESKNKTWSAIASKKGSATVCQPLNSRPPPPIQRQLAEPAVQEAHHSLPQRAPRAPPRERPEAEKPTSTSTETPVPEKKIPDSCQVFVGNLPTDIDYNALKEFFSSYGTVVDVKIHTSSASKIPYGFVAFTDETPVKAILSEKRIEYKGHRVNVEEKKQRGFFGGYNSRGRFQGQNFRGGFRTHLPRGGAVVHEGHSESASANGNRTPGPGAPKKVSA